MTLRRGYYTYEGRNHDVCQFHLRFDGSSVHGDGVDDVGSYNISGNYDARKHSISFVKQRLSLSHRILRFLRYRRGTRNQRGVLNEDNEGHAVTYTGRCNVLQSLSVPQVGGAESGCRVSRFLAYQELGDKQLLALRLRMRGTKAMASSICGPPWRHGLQHRRKK